MTEHRDRVLSTEVTISNGTPIKEDLPKIVNKALTIEEAYLFMGKFGKYQVLVAIAAGMSYVSGMLFLFSMPLFSMTPELSQCWVNGILTPCDQIDDKCAAGVTYKYSDNHYNFITEYDLLCDSFAVGLIPGATAIGSALGIALFGILADNIGRLPIMGISNGGIIICLLVIVLTSNYNVTLYFSAISGFLQAGAQTTPYAFAYDSATLDSASYYGTFVMASYAVGEVVIPLIMMTKMQWRNMCYIIMAWSATYFIMWFKLYEPARFIYGKGKLEQASEIIKNVSLMNSNEVPDSLVLAEPQSKKDQADSCLSLVKVLFTKIRIIQLLFCLAISFTWNTVYFGVGMNIQYYPGDVYLLAALNGAVEAVAIVISGVIQEKFGVRKIMIINFILTGIFLLIIGYAKLSTSASMTLVVISKFTISVVENGFFALVGELFPASMINTALAICSTVGTIGQVFGTLFGSNIILFNQVCGYMCFACLILVIILPMSNSQKNHDEDNKTEKTEHQEVAVPIPTIPAEKHNENPQLNRV